MLDWLLVFAGVNLAMSGAVALPSIAHRPHTARRLALAGLPALWSLLMVSAYLSLRAVEPPSPIAAGPDGHLIVLRHGNLDALLWEGRVSAASALAFWLTTATLLGLLALWLMRSLHAPEA